MNEFDGRWQECAARARQAAADPLPAPASFATRAWARWKAQADIPPVAGWTALALRALVLATLVLAICAVTELYAASPGSALAPHLEDVVTSVWGTL